jgi:hypothetical protein
MPDDPATRYVPSPNNADPFKEMSAVPPAEDVELLFDKLINKFPFQERYLGCTNPFTGREIQSESEYRSLVRESAYIRTLNQNTDAKSGKGAEQQEQRPRAQADGEQRRQNSRVFLHHMRIFARFTGVRYAFYPVIRQILAIFDQEAAGDLRFRESLFNLTSLKPF